MLTHRFQDDVVVILSEVWRVLEPNEVEGSALSLLRARKSRNLWHESSPISALESEGSRNHDTSQGDIVMKRITAIALFTVAAFVTAGEAMAQDHAVRATVPFAFTVGGKLLPSGNYEFTTPLTNVIEIKNRDNDHIVAMATTNYDRHESRKGGKLVFDRYGDQYFLSEILTPTAVNVSLPPSKQEKQARQQEATIHNASQILVAAK
jgi:hypothetical protein